MFVYVRLVLLSSCWCRNLGGVLLCSESRWVVVHDTLVVRVMCQVLIRMGVILMLMIMLLLLRVLMLEVVHHRHTVAGSWSAMLTLVVSAGEHAV